MDTQTCILTRRSHRQYQPKPVSHDLIEKIISLAAYAPSSKNTQISRYIAIEDSSVKQTIAEHYCLPDNNNPFIISNCPVLIAQTFLVGRSGFNRDGTYGTDRKDGWQYFDCGIAAQTFCLAAHDLGLGTVIIGGFDRKGLEAYLQIPQGRELMSLIALGWPADEPTAPRRKDVETLLTYL